MADPAPFVPFVPTWLDLPGVATDPSAVNPADLPDSGAVPGIGVPAPMFDAAAAQIPTPAPIDPSALQPGLGIPAPMFDAAAAQAQPPGGGSGDPFAGVDYVQNALNPIEAEQLAPGPGDQLPTAPYEQYAVPSSSPLEDPNSTPEERDEYAKRLALTDPAAFAELQTKHALARENYAATEMLAASERDRQSAEENVRIQREATARANARDEQLAQQAAELARTVPDQNRWWSSKTTGQKIANTIGALGGALSVAGAAYAGHFGLRNQFLDDMQKDIDDDINVQRENIERGIAGVNTQRGIVADIYRRTGDLYGAAETARIATYQRARQDVLAKQQLYDQRGTQAIALGQTAQELLARELAAREAAKKRWLDEQKALLEMEKTRADIAKTQAETAKKLGAGAGAKVVMTPGMWAHKNGLDGKPWGSAEQAAYNEYAAKAQASAARAPVTSTGAPPVTFQPASGATAPAAARASSGPASQAVKSAPPTATPAVPPSKAQQAPSSDQRKYQSNDDWFSANRPTITAEQREKYWFVDGQSGNTAPPIEIEGSSESANKFKERQRTRRTLSEKVDQLRVLTERLRKRGFWDKAVGNRATWTNDADVQEARALAEDVTGDIIQEKGMGVPSGNDVARVKTMAGGDPAGWQDSTPNLQRYRESLDIAQKNDWNTYVPGAWNKAEYIPFRKLPLASPDWIKTVEGRGQIKTVQPEEGNTDPAQLQGRSFEADAPNVQQAETNAQTKRRQAIASSYLEESGALARPDLDTPDALKLNKSSKVAETPQARDYTYKGDPPGADAWKRLRDLHVSNIAIANRLIRQPSDADWNALQKGEAEANSELLNFLAVNQMGGRYEKYFAPPEGTDASIYTLVRERQMAALPPQVLARITADILRSGGKQ